MCMAITLNTLSGKLLSAHLVLFLTFWSLALVCKNSFLFSFCLCVCLYALGRWATAPVVERVGFCRRCPVGQFLLVTRARCSGVSPVCAVCILLLCLDHNCALVGAVWLYWLLWAHGMQAIAPQRWSHSVQLPVPARSHARWGRGH